MSDRFTTLKYKYNDDDIWRKIVSILPREVLDDLDQLKFEIHQPYEGYKEYLVIGKTNKILASASISEIVDDLVYWSIYKEI